MFQWLTKFRGEWLVVAAAALAIAITLAPSAADAVQYDRALIARGQVWRILTGHLTHWTPSHLFWDVAAFAALALVCGRRSRRTFAACVVGSATAISAWLYWMMPEIDTYRGLSGIDTALFTLLAVQLWQAAHRNGARAARLATFVVIAALPAKTAFEWLTGETLFVEAANGAFTPLVSAHVVGAVVGLLIAVLPSITVFTRTKISQTSAVGSSVRRCSG